MQLRRRWLSGLSVVAGISAAIGPAQAADLGGERPSYRRNDDDRERERAPIWAGAYTGLALGIAGGGGQLKSATNDKLELKQDGSSGSASLYGGYNWQSGPWVYGVEGEVGGPRARLKGTNTTLGLVKEEAGVGGSLRLRGGYAVDNWLFYGTAGLAVAGSKLKGASVTQEKSQTDVGVVLGLGVEYALSSHWLLRAEHLSYGFGEKDVKLTPGAYDQATGVSTFRLGAAYKF